MHQTGSFRWQFSDPQCLITPLAGSGDAALPFTEEADGDTDAFKVPAGGVSAQVKDYNGNGACTLRLFDAATGQELDFATARPGADTVILTSSGRSTVYLGGSYCVIRVSAQP
ncbi:MAG: hypothetical protein M3256_10065 [Actinomycetota bacterium]|nr:hypothetical protein [Actinomycetota bacterium]